MDLNALRANVRLDRRAIAPCYRKPEVEAAYGVTKVREALSRNTWILLIRPFVSASFAQPHLVASKEKSLAHVRPRAY